MPKIKSEFKLNDVDVEKLKNKILQVGETSEPIINDYLRNVAGKKITEGITKFIPRSKRNKKHAKDSDWSEQRNFNLAINIANSLRGKNSFYYLYFPATGTSTSKKKGPNEFMQKGLDTSYDGVVNGLISELDKNIEKEMKI